MKRLFALILWLALATPAWAQLIRSSPTFIGGAAGVTLLVGNFDEYNVTLTANAVITLPINVTVPGTDKFRINTCQNSVGGWTPTFTTPSPGITIVNRVGAAVTTTTAFACDTEYWTYRSLTAQLVLEGVSFNTTGGAPLSALNVTGPVSVTNTSTDGSGKITCVNVNGEINPCTYGALGDGTDQTAAIQNAINAAKAAKQQVAFQSGVFVFGAINWTGTSFHGAGVTNTFLVTKPLQDGFASPEPTSADNSYQQFTNLYGFTGLVDDSQDASAAFPNRLLGRHAYDGATVSSSGVITSTNLHLEGGDVGNTITDTGGCIAPNTTIASLVNPASSTALAPVTQANISINATGTCNSDTFYVARDNGPAAKSIGNCFFAMPATDGNKSHWVNSHAQGLLHAHIHDIEIQGLTATTVGINSSCGIMPQLFEYDTHYDDVVIYLTQYAYNEIPPTNNAASSDYSPDDNSYTNFSITNATYSFGAYNGEHDTTSNLQIYGGGAGNLGFQLLRFTSSGRNQPFSWNINGLYIEPTSSSTGLQSRIDGRRHAFTSGSPKQANGAAYFQWDASESSAVNITVGNDGTNPALKVGGSFNTIVLHSTSNANIEQDSGFANNISYCGLDSFSMNTDSCVSLTASRPNVGVQTADFLYLAPDHPFSSKEGLLWTASALHTTATTTTWTRDEADEHTTVAPYGEYLTIPANGAVAITSMAKQNGGTLQVGTDLPQVKVTFNFDLRIGSGGTQLWKVHDNTTAADLATATFTLTTSFARYTIPVDLTGVATGDVIVINANADSSSASVDAQWIGVTINNPATPNFFFDSTAGTGKTYSTPSGATALYVCLGGPGGGGGAVISGGSTAIGGGNGAAGARICGLLTGALATTYAYDVGAGGTAGSCAVSPTAAGTGTATDFTVGVYTLTTGVGVGGTTTVNNATNGVASAASGACNASSSGDTGAVRRMDCLNGSAGAAGAGDARVNASTLGASAGGQSATVTSGGVCDLPATVGQDGWISFTAYGV